MASFSVINNLGSLNAQAALERTNTGLQKALNRLSTGLRINTSGDDAAGLAVANAFRAEVATLNQGIRNANDGLSTLQIKDGALDNVSNLINRLSTLASQAASGGTTDASRITLNTEFNDVLSEITRELTVGSLTTSNGFSVFVSNNGTNGKVSGTIAGVTTSSLTLAGHVLTSQALAESAVGAVASAVSVLGTTQGTIGSLQNRLQFAINLSQTQAVANQAAESRIRDANVATEAANLTRFSILNQSGIASLAQANNSIGSVLALLG